MHNSISSVLTLFAIAASASALAATPTPEKADVAWISTGEFCEPETLLPMSDKTFLVTNMCDFKKSGNGFI